jgi:hypothetical protein
MNEVKYPNVSVDLIGRDGNAFLILGRVMKEMRRGGVSAEGIEDFRKDATSGDYDNLLRVVMNYVRVV